MNDTVLRADERTVQMNPGTVARSRMLANRLRAGLVTGEMLAAAGYLGDASAVLVVAAWVPPPPEPYHMAIQDMGIEGVLAHAPMPKRVRVRLALDMADRAMNTWYERADRDIAKQLRLRGAPPPAGGHNLPRRCSAACHAWLADPTAETERAAFVTAQAVEAWQGDDDIDPLASAVARVGMAIGWHEWCAGSAADFAACGRGRDARADEIAWQVHYALAVLTGDAP